MGEVVFLSLTAALNPSLLAATTVMLLLPGPQRLMLGYWLGAMLMGITLGLVIVFTLEGSSVVSTTKRTVSPAVDLGLAAIALIIAVVLAGGRDKRFRERRARPREPKKPPRWQRALSKGTAKTTFLVGVLLSFPGASYLAGLDRISKLHSSTPLTVVIVIGFNLVMLILLEIPILAFAVEPKQTPIAIERAKTWARVHARTYATWGAAVIGAALAIRGIVELI